MILETIGTPGLSGLDKLISFFIVMELEALIHSIEKNVRNKTWTSMLDDCEDTLSSLDIAKSENSRRIREIYNRDKIKFIDTPIVYVLGNITKLHNSITGSSNKLWLPVLEWALKIGHYQLLRKKIAYELNTACKFEAKHMEAALRTLNTYVEIYLFFL